MAQAQEPAYNVEWTAEEIHAKVEQAGQQTPGWLLVQEVSVDAGHAWFTWIGLPFKVEGLWCLVLSLPQEGLEHVQRLPPAPGQKFPRKSIRIALVVPGLHYRNVRWTSPLPVAPGEMSAYMPALIPLKDDLLWWAPETWYHCGLGTPEQRKESWARLKMMIAAQIGRKVMSSAMHAFHEKSLWQCIQGLESLPVARWEQSMLLVLAARSMREMFIATYHDKGIDATKLRKKIDDVEGEVDPDEPSEIAPEKYDRMARESGFRRGATSLPAIGRGRGKQRSRTAGSDTTSNASSNGRGKNKSKGKYKPAGKKSGNNKK